MGIKRADNLRNGDKVRGETIGRVRFINDKVYVLTQDEAGTKRQYFYKLSDPIYVENGE